MTAWLFACGSDLEAGRVDERVDDTAPTTATDAISADAADTPERTDLREEPDAPPVDGEADSAGGGEAADATSEGELADGSDDAAPDALDAPDGDDMADVADAGADGDAALCLAGSPCAFQGYLPGCFEARCNDRGSCVAGRVAGCCLADVDCPLPDAGPCATVRCLQSRCTTLPVPGCCVVEDAESCDDGLASTSDACDADSGHCVSCPLACGARSPFFAASFDGEADSPSALGFFVFDQQAGDAVGWQRVSDVFAAGGGAVYLGNPRCGTYYGGALGADCRPLDPTGQDSVRIVVGLHSPFIALPADSPALLTAWVRASVEPLAQLGQAEPDVLQISVEPLGALSTLWPVASTLDLGKSTDWVPIAVDLAPWRGQSVRLRFDFDTLDGESNDFPGVWLDEIVVREACTDGGCCADDTDCGGSTACARGACLLTAQGGARVCATLARSPGTLCTPCASDAVCADSDPCTDDVCLPGGACGHTSFCCLERDLFAEAFDATLGAMTALDDDPLDAVGWSVRGGAAWFGDAATGNYGAAGRVSGALVTPAITLPSALAAREKIVLTLSLRLSTEWDLAGPDELAARDNPAGLDRLTIAVEDGAFSTIVWSSDQIGGSTSNAALPITLELAPWLGRTISVRIRFDSGDETLNAFAGPFIDDLALGLRCE